MITIEKLGILLSPTENEFESLGVLNPGIYQDGETVPYFIQGRGERKLFNNRLRKSKGPLRLSKVG